MQLYQHFKWYSYAVGKAVVHNSVEYRKVQLISRQQFLQLYHNKNTHGLQYHLYLFWFKKPAWNNAGLVHIPFIPATQPLNRYASILPQILSPPFPSTVFPVNRVAVPPFDNVQSHTGTAVK
jgi:hypothetical protein